MELSRGGDGEVASDSFVRKNEFAPAGKSPGNPSRFALSSPSSPPRGSRYAGIRVTLIFPLEEGGKAGESENFLLRRTSRNLFEQTSAIRGEEGTVRIRISKSRRR